MADTGVATGFRLGEPLWRRVQFTAGKDCRAFNRFGGTPRIFGCHLIPRDWAESSETMLVIRIALRSQHKHLSRHPLLRPLMTAPPSIYSKYPFAAPVSNADENVSSPAQSRRPVTLPPLPELHFPFDQILHSIPASDSPVNVNSAPAPSHPFLDSLKLFQNHTETWNGAAAFRSTLSPTLDAFHGLSQATKVNNIADLLDNSWRSDPDATMRIIWNLRSIHQGKAAKDMFYRAFGWLYQSHPKTAIGNLHQLVDPVIRYTIKRKLPPQEAVEDDMDIITHEEANGTSPTATAGEEIESGRCHGYWKDLLNILLLATTEQLTPKSNLSALGIRSTKGPFGKSPDTRAASDKRGEKYSEWHNRIVEKLKNDIKFRVLYIRVAQLFANALSRDIDILKQIADTNTTAEHRTSLTYDLTLVGKWAPSLNASHDRMTNIATAIAQLLYNQGQLPLTTDGASFEQPLTQENAHKLRSAYARWITTPLRRYLQIPEVAMSARRWDKIKYDRVPSQCMKNNKETFFKHDEGRFSQYLMDVDKGLKKLSGATLLPHEVLAEAFSITGSAKMQKKLEEMQSQVINQQWRSLVARVREAGTLDNAIAVCDVSGSMGSLRSVDSKGQPIFPAVALSILLSEIARPPWNNCFITFSAQPEMLSLDPAASLLQRARKMEGSAWSMNTDFNAVFTKLILPAAIEAKLKPEDMVKRLFVFSDMQFDDSRPRTERVNPWESEHQIIKGAFEQAGYQMPEIVYWNLSGSTAKPITKDETGVAMLSGFSPNMLKIFLEEGQLENEVPAVKCKADDEDCPAVQQKRTLTPEETMLRVLGHESFSGLQVID